MPTALLLTAWIAVVLARGTRVGMQLRRWMVDGPADRLSRIGRARCALAAALTIVAGLALYADGDLARAMAMAGPDIAAMMAAADGTVLLDAAIGLALAAAATPWRAILLRFRRGPARTASRPRARKSAARRVLASKANDDERHPRSVRVA